MFKPLHSFSLVIATLVCGSAFAQPLPPYQITITGTVLGCNSPGGFVTISTLPETLPEMIDIEVPLDANCGWSVLWPVMSYSGGFVVNTACGPAVVTTTGQYVVDFLGNATVQLTLDCNAAPPYIVTIQGTVGVGMPSQAVNISTAGSTVPALDVNLIANTTDGTFSFIHPMGSSAGSFVVTTNCNGAVQSVTLPYVIDMQDPNGTVLFADLDCGNEDCLGAVGGSAHTGTPCDDGDPETYGDLWSAGCNCIGFPDPGYPVTVSGVIAGCTGWAQVRITSGQFLDTTIPVASDCSYSYTFMSYLGGGNVEVSTSCDWGITPITQSSPYSPTTSEITLDFNCPAAPTPCFACFTTTQSSGGGILIPFQAELSNCITGGTAPYSYSWLFNNGSVSSDPAPVVTFPTPGEYITCLNVVDANGTLCSDCDTVYVDANGTITPYPPCLACMTITQGIDGASIDPFVVEVITCTTGGSGNFAFAVDWGDGSTGSSLGEHTYAGPGVYDVCIVATGAAGEQCSRCTTIDIDAAGVVNTSDVGAPYSLSVRVDLQECDPGTMVRLRTLPGTLPAFDNEVELDQDCSYVQSYAMTSSSGWVEMTLLCDASFPTAALPYDFASNVGSLQFFHPGCTPDFPDCLGVNNGTALPGTPCENPVTNETGTWSAACVCVPNTTLPCQAEFFVMQAYEWVDEPSNPNGGGGEPIPNELWVWNLSSGGTGFFQFTWSFGDGTSSTDAYPTHTYASGEYELCLTILDNAGCTDEFCHTVSVDGDGILNGLTGGTGNRNAFTIRVMDPLTTSVNEEPVFTDLATWPNPVDNELNVTLNSALKGNARVTITDLSGRVVMDENRAVMNGLNRMTVPVSGLNAGLYMLRIGNGTNTMSSRFVKVH